MESTVWAPGSPISISERRLGLAIRRGLPSLRRYRCAEWVFGRLGVARAERDNAADCQLLEMWWRLREERDWHERESAEFEFSGQALISGACVDFCGEALMDMATGGYFEFQLKTWGG